MIRRQTLPLLKRRLASSAAVALTGPRQCGKTTLARLIGGAYFDLEQEQERLRLDLEWASRIAGRERLILDETQSWPQLFPRLRGAIDADPERKGRFLLLGSVSPALMRQVSESLAGRLALVELTPLLLTELRAASSLDRLWLCGGFPDGGALGSSRFPQWQKDYAALLAQRDLPNWGLPAKPQMTARFLRMIAAVHGQIWNASQVGQSLGISYHTVNDYLDFLESAFLVRRLSPYLPNLRKRLVRSPKVYWRDPGLLHGLLNVGDRTDLLAQPWVGASWEGFVIEQALGTLGAVGALVEPYYLRTSDQYEIDLVLDFGRERWAVEVKLTSSPGPQDMARLDHAAGLIGASRRFLVSQTKSESGNERSLSCDLPAFLRVCQSRKRPSK